MADRYATILPGGRVMDPETVIDAVRDLAILGGTIARVGTVEVTAAHDIDAAGLIVAPGFLDLHARGQSVAADRIQAFDGVTTSLELEVGALPVAGWYDRQAGLPCALNHGTAAAWAFARKAKMRAITLDPTCTRSTRWAREPRTSPAPSRRPTW